MMRTHMYPTAMSKREKKNLHKRFEWCNSYFQRFISYANSLLDVFLSFNLFYYNANSIRNRIILFSNSMQMNTWS